MKKDEKASASADDRNADEAMQHRARELHVALFEEEYDFIYDSSLDAKERSLGINPMSREYVEKRNAYRAALGFAPFHVGFHVGSGAGNYNTFEWVLKKLQNGKEAELREIIENRASEELETERQRERARQQLQTPSWTDQMIDDMLSGTQFIFIGQDRADPRIIAFRILGGLFKVNPSGNSKPEFFRQIRRLVPDRSEAEYQALYRHAMNEWMEAYGY